MINGAALTDLKGLLADPNPLHVTRVLSIPGLYKLLNSNSKAMKDFVLPLADSLPLLRWLADRATEVLNELCVEPESLPQGSISSEEENWRVVCRLWFSLHTLGHLLIYNPTDGVYIQSPADPASPHLLEVERRRPEG
jgi:hypothetical protein